MYTITLLKKGEIIFYFEEANLETTIIFFKGYYIYKRENDNLNLHISKFIDGKLDESFSLSELGI